MFFVCVGSTFAMILAAGVFKAMGQGSGTPSIQAYCVKSLDKSRAGVTSSTILIGQSIGNAVSPILGSFVVRAADMKHYSSAPASSSWQEDFVLMIQRNLDKKKEQLPVFELIFGSIN